MTDVSLIRKPMLEKVELYIWREKKITVYFHELLA